MQRICSSADGTLYSMYRMNDLIAASRMFLEPAPFSARCFQMIQEVHDERGIYVLHLQLRRRDL